MLINVHWLIKHNLSFTRCHLKKKLIPFLKIIIKNNQVYVFNCYVAQNKWVSSWHLQTRKTFKAEVNSNAENIMFVLGTIVQDPSISFSVAPKVTADSLSWIFRMYAGRSCSLEADAARRRARGHEQVGHDLFREYAFPLRNGNVNDNMRFLPVWIWQHCEYIF